MNNISILRDISAIQGYTDGERKSFQEKLSEVINITEPTFVAQEFFVTEVSKFAEVFAVYSIVKEGVIDLWTIIEGDLYKAEGKVIDAQIKLLDEFPGLLFDFMVLPKTSERLEEIIPSDATQLYLRE